jgi:hypothetical protein
MALPVQDRRCWGRAASAIFGVCFACSAFLGAPHAAAAEVPDLGNEPYEWNYVFPIWGKELASKGIQFPLPFGFGVTYLEAVQPIDVKNLEVAVNDGEFKDMSRFVKFESLDSNVQAVNARLDLWVLPFLNVYGLANYLISTEGDAVLSKPFPLRAGSTQTGYGGGFGVTGAFGFWGFFGSADMNFTWNQLSNLDSPVRTFVLAPRVGKRFKLNNTVSIATWIGAMRQDVQADTSGSLKLSDAVGDKNEDTVEGQIARWYRGLGPDEQASVNGFGDRFPTGGDPTIHYKLDKALANPWNGLIGMEADFSRRIQIRTELGFFGRTQMLVGVNYRFSIIEGDF